MWRTDGFERPGARNALAAEPVLGLPEVQPSLLDNVSVAAGRCAGRGATPRRCRQGSAGTAGCCATGSQTGDHGRVASSTSGISGYSMDFLLDDEDDEVFDDEEFDEDSEDDEDAEDSDEDDEEEEETWQVAPCLDFVG